MKSRIRNINKFKQELIKRYGGLNSSDPYWLTASIANAIIKEIDYICNPNDEYNCYEITKRQYQSLQDWKSKLCDKWL